jgi:hypothetical protein
VNPKPVEVDGDYEIRTLTLTRPVKVISWNKQIEGELELSPGEYEVLRVKNPFIQSSVRSSEWWVTREAKGMAVGAWKHNLFVRVGEVRKVVGQEKVDTFFD